ncbi:MAG: hypothetical protein IT429_07795 [Gemmataceae bacterium]|nr:hypothetical protein [Gemmataceae bacterium]
MIKVRVCQKTPAGGLVEKGYLECRGIKVKRPDGSVQLDVGPGGQPVGEELILHPPGLVSAHTAVRIGFALCDGQVNGETDGIDWFVVS